MGPLHIFCLSFLTDRKKNLYIYIYIYIDGKLFNYHPIYDCTSHVYMITFLLHLDYISHLKL